MIACNFRKRVEANQMPAGGHASVWRELDRYDTTVGQIPDRFQQYRKTYYEQENLPRNAPAPPAVKGQNATYFENKYGLPSGKATTAYHVFKDCFPDEVRRRVE